MPVTRSNDPCRKVLSKSVGPDIHQLGGKVSVYRRGFRKEFSSDWARYFQVLCERRGRVDQNIVPRLHRPLITRTGCEVRGIATERAANGGHRLCGIIQVVIRRFRPGGGGRQTPIPPERISFPCRVQEVSCIAAARRRPVIFFPPLVGGHYENLY